MAVMRRGCYGIPVPPDTLEILTEIRDAQKEQTAMLREMHEQTVKAANDRKRTMVRRLITQGILVVLIGAGYFFYYRTITTMLTLH